MTIPQAPKKGSYWVSRCNGETFRVDGIVKIPIEGGHYAEDRVIFVRTTQPVSRSGMTFTLPVSQWEKFAREP